MTDAVLTLNAGSSSLKFAVFERRRGDLAETARGRIEGLGASPRLIAEGPGSARTEKSFAQGMGHEALLEPLFAWADGALGADRLRAVGHRIVHGGAQFAAPTLIDDGVMLALRALTPLAPLHQPHTLAAVDAARRLRGDLPQVACFDTAFHHGQAEVVTRLALPEAWRERGVRRYGFHGLSYEYICGRLKTLDPVLAEGRAVIAHLGSGASLCGVAKGRSVDSSMGFSTLDGLMMSTRCGALDPGVALYLLQEGGLTPEALSTLLYQGSGLLGVSGISGDMRALLGSEAPEAKRAIELFVFMLARQTGALLASLGGLDGFVFTAGVGENSASVRALIAERLAFTGLSLDPAANQRGAGRIESPQSPVRCWVIPTDEEAMIARHTVDLALGGMGD